MFVEAFLVLDELLLKGEKRPVPVITLFNKSLKPQKSNLSLFLPEISPFLLRRRNNLHLRFVCELFTPKKANLPIAGRLA